MSQKDTDPTVAKGSKRDGTIQSISIAARFLKILAHASEPLVLGVIAKRAETVTSTAHRYMQSLVKEGLAQQDPASGRYSLGSSALNIGIAALNRIDPVEIAADHMKILANMTSASAGVAIWTDRGPTLVRWYRSSLFSISSVGLGDVLPLDNTACGLVFQAFLPETTVERARQIQPETFRGKKPAKSLLANIQKECWMELSSHLLTDIIGQAVPVFDAQNEIACVMTTITNLGQIYTAEEAHNLQKKSWLVAQETGGTGPYAHLLPPQKS